MVLLCNMSILVLSLLSVSSLQAKPAKGNEDRADREVKLVDERPYLLIGSTWKPICGHYFWNDNVGASIFCKKLGYPFGGTIEAERNSYNEDAFYVGGCRSNDITDLENGCTKPNLVAPHDCKKGRPVSIKIKCTGKLWRDDGRCGVNYRLPNGTYGQCDPKGTYPCCSPHGWCGVTSKHCRCETCINYAELPCPSDNINYQSRKDAEVLKKIGSAEECSKKCREKTTCNFWTWYTVKAHSEGRYTVKAVKAFDCVLMSNYAYTKSDNSVISGERSCNPGGTEQGLYEYDY